MGFGEGFGGHVGLMGWVFLKNGLEGWVMLGGFVGVEDLSWGSEVQKGVRLYRDLAMNNGHDIKRFLYYLRLDSWLAVGASGTGGFNTDT